MAEIAKLKLQRGTLKRKLTQFAKILQTADKIDDYDEVKLRLDKIEPILDSFEEIHVELAVLDASQDHDTYRDEFENEYELLTRQARKFLKENAPPVNNTSVNNTVQKPDTVSNSDSNVRLPVINLPIFSGAYDEWRCFYDSFNSIVHQKLHIPNIEKLHYLRSCLRGEAAAIIQCLETADNNYEIAWSLLIETYNNERVIVNNHLKALLEQPACTRENASSMKQIKNNINIHTRALKKLGVPVDTWDTILIYLMTAKLDKHTLKEWEKSIKGKHLPTLKQFVAFLESHSLMLEAVAGEQSNVQPKTSNNSKQYHHKQHDTKHNKNIFAITQKSEFCNFCKGAHKIFNCERFKKMSVQQRIESVKKEKLCFNCLRRNHSADKCICGPCKTCGKKHNSLIHNEADSSSNATPNPSIHNLQSPFLGEVLLGTAKIEFLDKNNKKTVARVVLDGGAQAHLISERFAKLLGLNQTKINIPVSSIDHLETNIKHFVTTRIFSMYETFELNLPFLVVKAVTNPLPSQQINIKQLGIPKNIQLADPSFCKTSEVDALIGAEIFYHLLQRGRIILKNESALIQETKFGWIVVGKIFQQNLSSKNISCNIALTSLNNQIAKFWEIEETPEKRYFSREEIKTEQHFTENVTRQDNGRYIVKLPFNEHIHNLGESYSSALKRFYTLERKLNKNPVLKEKYIAFMREYEGLNHMTVINKHVTDTQDYFLPHHAVIKDSSTTTKVRVVFDGSAKSSTGISLNNALEVGPTIQDDIFSILLRFRMHNYVFIADIEKMYRQILVDKNDTNFQKILWRESSSDTLKIYKLNTVTYGTKSAPFLAIRTLHKLAEDEKHNFPMAANIVKRDFYVDDLLTGSDTIENALNLRDEIINLLKAGGFTLRQWASNNLDLINSLPHELTNLELFADPSKSVKTLGIQWNSQRDIILYTLQENTNSREKITKRTILSKIAQLFDPIGLLGPIIVRAKIIMQDLWKAKLDWDDSVSTDLHSRWVDYEGQLPLLTNISFDRQFVIKDAINIQIHGFCDASEVAYAASIYIRSTDAKQQCLTRLLCSKSRVAPLKSTSIPRLELCAALLLAKLYKSVVAILPITFDKVFFWSDSLITLTWINTQPYTLKTFVANRVAEITTITNQSDWRHVPTKENPADFLSRGQTVREFLINNSWKTGPSWLSKNKENWPQLSFNKVPLLEIKKTTVLKITVKDTSVLTKFSSFTKLIRVMAYCLRFVNNSLKRTKLVDGLTTDEIQHAHDRVITLIQYNAFSRELEALATHKLLDKQSSLLSLNPFLDDNNILRVGGRIKRAEIPYDSKHPIVLPKNNHVTNLIIRNEHESALHAGVQNTLYRVRAKYWPIDGKNTVRRIIHSCIKCFRFKTREPNHLMGDLPKSRLIASRPFINTGVDYCGPFFIKERKYRNRNKIKVYVCIFICFSTRAIHLELVSDLTTDSFLASLKRFFARRGKSRNLYSDNATNFVGANNELKKLHAFLNSDKHNSKVFDNLANQGIKWHFIPPRSPHFGGAWESGVKSFKIHFMRTVGNTLLTFEEFNTHIIEIEAILNSRPLTPLSSDPNDLTALTPGHFLINDSLMSIPDPDLANVPNNRLSNWQHLQQLKQHFWKRWHTEYLNNLNVRHKWKQGAAEEFKIGTMVLVKEEHQSPLQWAIGRITDVHPGEDDIIRVVTIKTVNGLYKRSVKKLAILPIDNECVSNQ